VHAITVARRAASCALDVKLFAPELHHQAKLAFAEQRFDRAHDPGTAADHDPLADLMWLLPAEVAGHEYLVSATKLIAGSQACKATYGESAKRVSETARLGMAPLLRGQHWGSKRSKSAHQAEEVELRGSRSTTDR
jgi:hypothetical protein